MKANTATCDIHAGKVGLFARSAGAHLSGLAALPPPEITRFGSGADSANAQKLAQTTQVQAVVSWALPPASLSGNPTFALANFPPRAAGGGSALALAEPSESEAKDLRRG
jgi:hypothetical protein